MNRFGGHMTQSTLLRRSATFTATLLLALAAGCGGGMMETGTGSGSGLSDDYRVHDEAGIEILVPSGWNVETDADSMTISHPSDEISLAFMVLDDEWEAAMGLDALEEEVSRWVEDVESDDDFTDIDVNGMPAMYLDATGYVDGVPVELGLMLVHTPNDKVLLVFGMVIAEKMDAHEADLKRIMNGLRPIGGGAELAGGEADVRIHEEAGIEISVPAGWVTDSGDDMLTIADPGDQVAITFIIMDTVDLAAALDALDSELTKFVDDLKPESDAMETDINGMEAMFMDASGTVDGAAVEIGIFVILTPTGKAMLMFGVIAADADPTLETDVDKLMRSLRPM